MIFREATIGDIKQIQVVRHLVKENTLSDPSLVPDSDVQDFLFRRGKGWVCLVDDVVVGFAIADLQDNNIWALFVDPDHAQKGIGKQLHGLMLTWYFKQGKDSVWLGTAPNTRAATFYKMQGWKETGMHGKNEIKFEMTKDDFDKNNKAK